MTIKRTAARLALMLGLLLLALPGGTRAETTLNLLWSLCKSRLRTSRFFARGVAGSTGYVTDEDGNCVQLPLHVEPRGIVEPFEWILNQLR